MSGHKSGLAQKTWKVITSSKIIWGWVLQTRIQRISNWHGNSIIYSSENKISLYEILNEIKELLEITDTLTDTFLNSHVWPIRHLLSRNVAHLELAFFICLFTVVSTEQYLLCITLFTMF